MICRIGRCAGLGAAILLILLSPVVQAQQTDTALPVDDYWQLLQEIQAQVDGLESPPSEANLAQLADAAERLEQVTAVTLPDGTIIPVDQSFLAAQLRAEPPDDQQLSQLLASQLAARQEWPQSGHQSSDVASLQEILAQPQFQWPEQKPSAFQEWLNGILEKIRAFLQRFQPEGGGSPIWNRVLTAVGALLLALVLFFALRGLFTDFVAESELRPAGLPDAEMLTADSAFNRAQDFSGSGDYRTAVRYLYLSLLLMLEERGWLRYDRAKTNREYLRSVAQQPELAATLRDIIDVFDRVWYGFQPLDETAYTRYAAQVKELQKRR